MSINVHTCSSSRCHSEFALGGNATASECVCARACVCGWGGSIACLAYLSSIRPRYGFDVRSQSPPLSQTQKHEKETGSSYSRPLSVPVLLYRNEQSSFWPFGCSTQTFLVSHSSTVSSCWGRGLTSTGRTDARPGAVVPAHACGRADELEALRAGEMHLMSDKVL